MPSGSPVRGPLRDPLRDPLPGPPRPAPPARGRPGGGAGPPAPGAPRPGAPRGPPGRPPGRPLRDPLLGPDLGPLYMVFVLVTPQMGVPRGCTLAPPGRPPGGAPRGGAKKCTFFWVFNNSPSRDSLGLPGGPGDTPAGPPILAPIRGTCGGQCLWDRLTPRVACPRWAGPLGRRASDGYPLAGLTANGWYVPSGRGPPSRQGRKSAQDREVAGRRRPFARAKRGPTTGVTGKVRKCLAEQAMPYQSLVG